MSFCFPSSGSHRQQSLHTALWFKGSVTAPFSLFQVLRCLLGTPLSLPTSLSMDSTKFSLDFPNVVVSFPPALPHPH